MLPILFSAPFIAFPTRKATRVLGYAAIAAVLLLASGAFPASSWAREPLGDTPVSFRHQDARDTALVQVQGSLTCESDRAPSGQTQAQAAAAGNGASASDCALRLREAQTGKSYQLNGSDKAMELYHAGSREVSVEGTIPPGAEDAARVPVISVHRISAAKTAR